MKSLWDGFNKRKFPRLHLTCQVAIQPIGHQKPMTASSEDVGLGGVSVMLDEPLERFERCKISLELLDGKPPIQCIGRSVWVVPSQNLKSAKKNFDIGFEFMDMDDSSRKRLQAFITPPLKQS